MTREEHLRHCKICLNQKNNPARGIVCKLTDEYADFEEKCDLFIENPELALKQREADFQEVYESVDKGTRFLNRLLDFIFLLLISFILGIFLGIFFAIVYPPALYMFEVENKVFDYIAAFLISMIYYVALEASTGRTIGKFITKTKVVDEKGQKPVFSVIFMRSLCRFIPFDALSFLFSSSGGWHDTISNTRVVKINRPQPKSIIYP